MSSIFHPAQDTKSDASATTTRLEIPDLIPALASGATVMVAQAHEAAQVQKEGIRAKLQQKEKYQDVKLQIAKQQYELERDKLLSPEERHRRWLHEQCIEQAQFDANVRNKIKSKLLYYSSCRASMIWCHSVADQLEIDITTLVGERWSEKLQSLMEFFKNHKQRCQSGTNYQHVREWIVELYPVRLSRL